MQNRRRGGASPRRTRVSAVIAVLGLLAAFVAPAHVRAFGPIDYTAGSAHINVTTEQGDTYSVDLPMYPPPSGPNDGLLQAGDANGHFGPRPPRPQWDPEDMGGGREMQFIFADLPKTDPAPPF